MDFFLILVIIVSFIYKRYIDNRLRNGESPLNLVGAFSRFAAFHNVLPIKKEKYDGKFHSLVERGNLAILVFYIGWTLLIIIILLDVIL
jgi:hypothetical protein